MDEPTTGSDNAAMPPIPGAALDADTIPVLAQEAPDRSMLVMQYGLAVIAVIGAFLLSRAS